jgi:hypothetical protein
MGPRTIDRFPDSTSLLSQNAGQVSHLNATILEADAVTGAFEMLCFSPLLPAINSAGCFGQARSRADIAADSDCRSAAKKPAPFLSFLHDLSLPHLPVFRIIFSSGTRQPSLVGARNSIFLPRTWS